MIEVSVITGIMANNNRSPENIPLISEERVDDHGSASEGQDDSAEKESLTDEESSLALVWNFFTCMLVYIRNHFIRNLHVEK